MATLTTAPWTESVTNIPASRIAVIYDTRLPWAQEACEYYCDQRGIPRDNLFVPPLIPTPTLSVNGYPEWSPTTAQLVAVCTAIGAHFDAIDAAGVVLGPGFPTLVNLTKSNAGLVVIGETLATSLPYIIAASRMIVARHTPGWEICVVGDTGPSSLIDKNPSTPVGDGVTLSIPFARWENLGEGVAVEVLTGATEQEVYPHPTLAQMQIAYDGHRSIIPFGILGWPVPQVGRIEVQTAESLVTIKALIDRVSVAMRDAAGNATKRSRPTLYSLIDVGGGSFSMPEHKFYCNKLIEWGLAVDYYYPYAATDGGTAPLVAGQWHTPSELAAGVTPLQYFMRLGATINGQDTAGGVYDSNQSPLAGGVSMVSGESYGTRANHHALAEQGACAGTVETMHITPLYGLTQLGKHALLLRGMTMLEACVWTSAITGELACQVPCGDTLYAPYGARRFLITGKLVPSAIPVRNDSPAQFYFADVAGTVALNSTQTAVAAITVTGINVPVPISISGSGGRNHEYQINGGNWTSAAGTIQAGQTVLVRHTASGSNNTSATTTLTIGGVSDTFTSTTVAASGFSAVLNTSTGVMTITGTGFGTKSPAAPIWMETFESATLGDNPAQAGFDLWASGTPQVPVVTAGQGVGGGRSLRSSHTGTIDDFAHVEKLIADTDTLFMSSWNKLTASSSSGRLQLKSHRSGPRQSDTDAAANYATTPYAKGSLWFNSGVTWSEIQTEPNREGGSHPESASSVQTDPGGIGSGLQIYTESFFQMNTPNLYDGLYQVLVNGTQLYNQTTRCFRESSAHHFGFASFAPGLTNSTWTFTRDLSRPYVDNTRMRVFLGNSATLAGCTGRFLLRPTTWVDDAIIATEGKNYPSGYNYLYAIDADGAQIPLNGSLNGFAYSTI